MHHVYILLLSNGDLYKGSTEDLKRRIKEHSSGGVISTRNFRPFKLIYYEAYLLKEDALRRELFLKTNEGRKSLKRQLSVFLNNCRVV